MVASVVHSLGDVAREEENIGIVRAGRRDVRVLDLDAGDPQLLEDLFNIHLDHEAGTQPRSTYGHELHLDS